MKLTPYDTDDGLHLVKVETSTNDFMSHDHPALAHLINMVLNGEIEEDLTLANVGAMPDAYIKTDWEKARYVAENLACLLLADISTTWGMGYRSDDGYDYLTAALDNVRFLTDIDLDEADFLAWWNAPSDGSYPAVTPSGTHVEWGGCDGELRFTIFNHRADSEFSEL